MRRTEAVVIGGGQAGLAMSRCLKDSGVDHVVLERGRVAERWRSERWESLRLLTPSWQSRLPGFRYEGPDPDGYMSMPEVVDYLERFARSFVAPVEEGTTVLAVEPSSHGYRVTTDRGSLAGAERRDRHRPLRHPVRAGACGDSCPPTCVQVVPTRYRKPVPAAGRAASSSWARPPPASSSPTRSSPRVDRSPSPWAGTPGCRASTAGATSSGGSTPSGSSDESAADVFDLAISRNQPSLQLVGRPDRATLDLPALQDRGVRLVGPRRGCGWRPGLPRRRPGGADGRGGRPARAPRPEDRHLRRAHRPRRRGGAARALPPLPLAGSGARGNRPAGARASGRSSGRRASGGSTRG